MNYNLSIVAAIIFLVAAVAAERMSHWQVQDLQARRAVLTAKVTALNTEAGQAAAEKKKYQKAEADADEIQKGMTRHGDNTSLIQWFDTSAKNWSVALVVAKVVAADRDTQAGAYRRIRLAVQVRGAYLGLLKYVESVERCSIPMVIDTFSLSADQEFPGTGDLNLTVSCLFPTSTEKSPRTGGMQ